MKKRIIWTLSLLMLWSVTAMGSEANTEKNYDQLVVGNTTHLSGNFFTDMWGNATSDLDVRKLIHSYPLVIWNFEEGLFQINPTVVSGFVATQNSAGDHIYQISLYDDLYYSDGSEITAKDYAFSILLQLSPQLGELGANTEKMEYIQGADAWKEGSADVLSGVRILGERELKVTVDSSYLPYFYELGLLNTQPYPAKEIAPGVVIKDDGEGVYLANEDEGVSEPVFTASLLEDTILDPEHGYRIHPSVTSGPYVLSEFDGETAVFKINPYYKGDAEGSEPTIETLVYTVADNSTMIHELENGSFDLLNKVSAQKAIAEGLALTSSGKDFSMSAYPRNGMCFVAFSQGSVPSQDEAVRKAIAWCLNREAIANGYEGNYGLPVEGYFGMGQWMYGLVNGTVPYPVHEDPEDEEAELAAWEALNLEGLETYSSGDEQYDVSEAVRILEEDGWILNEQGGAFDPSSDTVRCKEADGELVPLRLTLAYPKGNTAGGLLQDYLAAPLAEAGAELELEALDFTVILADFYGQEDSGADLLYLATNFDEIFDPSAGFRMDDEGHALWGESGIDEDELYALAVDMRRTAPGDVYGYCRKWLAFQEEFTRTLPLLPIYSNVYFDFYTSALQNYDPMKQVSWSQEILYSVYGDAPTQQSEEGQELLEGTQGVLEGEQDFSEETQDISEETWDEDMDLVEFDD